VVMIIPMFVWWSPVGRCYGNKLNLEDVRRRLRERPLLFALAFDSGSDDREAVFKRLYGSNPATSYTSLASVQ